MEGEGLAGHAALQRTQQRRACGAAGAFSTPCTAKRVLAGTPRVSAGRRTPAAGQLLADTLSSECGPCSSIFPVHSSSAQSCGFGEARVMKSSL